MALFEKQDYSVTFIITMVLPVSALLCYEAYG